MYVSARIPNPISGNCLERGLIVNRDLKNSTLSVMIDQ